MSSKIVEDVKTGIKGVRGAGDALRGNLMGAADQAFDSGGHARNDPTTKASELKNQTIAAKGKSDMQAVDDRLADREREHEVRKQDRLQRQQQHQEGLAASGTNQVPSQMPNQIPNQVPNQQQQYQQQQQQQQRQQEATAQHGLASNGAGAQRGVGHHPMPLP